MARKAEVGIEYFPMNSDIIHNPKIKLVVAEFGSKHSWAVLLPLLCKIYREKGYWIDWHDEDSKLLFAQDECKLDVNLLNEVVNGFVRRSFFDKKVFDTFGVLTSDRIQENYLVAKARNKEVNFIEEFALKNEKDEFVYKLFQNVNIIDLNVNIIKKNVNISTQKEKEKKNKIIEGDSAKASTHTSDELELFKNFQTWLGKNAPRVNTLKEPLTIDDYLKLRKKLSKEVLQKLLLAMQNYKPLTSKNISAYLTVINWSKREDDLQNPGAAAVTNSNLSEAVKAIEKNGVKKV